MITLMAGLVILMLWRRPDWVASRLFHRLAVMPLARLANRITRQHVLFALLMVVVLTLAGELIAAMSPLDMGLVMLWDVAGFTDALITVVSVAVVARTTARFWQWIPARLHRRPQQSRAARQCHRRTRPSRADNDDDRPADRRAA